MPTNPPHLRPPGISIRDFLRYYAGRKRDRGQPVFCFQIGANDGRSNDPVHLYFRNYGWSGLLVEPLPDVFENELKRTYAGNPRVTLENVALASTAGSLPFYRVAISNARWATGLSGFRRENIQNHIDNGYIQRRARDDGIAVPEDPEQLIEVLQVPTMTVQQVLAKHGVRAFDVLCIDTEGYDFELLKLVDLQHYSPEVIVFESKNLSDKDYKTAKKLLSGHGYDLYWDRGDTLATRIPYPQSARMEALARVPWERFKTLVRPWRQRFLQRQRA